MTIPFPCLLRPAEDRDTAFVIGSWLESYKNAAPKGTWRHQLPWPRYRRQQTAVIKHAMEHGSTVVACVPDDTDHLLGFACGRGSVVHYVHVRPERRRLGLATMLVQTLSLGGGTCEASHMTPAGEHLGRKFSLTYNPLSAMVE